MALWITTNISRLLNWRNNMQQLTEAQRSIRNEEQFRIAFGNLHLSAIAVIMVRTREPFRVIA